MPNFHATFETDESYQVLYSFSGRDVRSNILSFNLEMFKKV